MKKVGRPKNDNPRGRVLSVRLNRDEWAILQECASVKKATMTDIARNAIIKECSKLLENSSVR